MRILGWLVIKELTLLRRDWHALLLLFAMPVAFILVMSLALQGQFATHNKIHIQYALVDQGQSGLHQTLIEQLESLQGFERIQATGNLAAEKTRVRSGDVQFLVVLPARSISRTRPIEIYAAPEVGAAVYRLFEAAVHQKATKAYYMGHAPGSKALTSPAAVPDIAKGSSVSIRTLSAPGVTQEKPSSVQQSVPAWLLFAMFFIAIPLSTTWLSERHQGTYARLRSIGLSAPMLLCGKLIPYVALNLTQVAVMLAVGVYLVPLCGGQALTLSHDWAALVVVSTVASFAAVGYALLVANLVTTSEQATLFTGVTNLLMAAIGGIMVPRFIMPHSLQVLSHFSPMAWGLDGFLDLFLRGSGWADMLPTILKLCAFGLVCLMIAATTMHYRSAK